MALYCHFRTPLQCQARYLSTILQKTAEAPYVHNADQFIKQGKSCITKDDSSQLPGGKKEKTKPSSLNNLQKTAEAPYVHIADQFIKQGKSCITKDDSSQLPGGKKEKTKSSSRNIATNYIFDKGIARKVANLILPHHNPDNLFIEINPGIGCLTAELLSNGLNALHLIEANQSFLDYLKTYKQFSEHVHVFNQRFSYYRDAVSMSSMWVELLQKDWCWDSDPQASVFGVIPPRQERIVIPWLVKMISSWHKYGRFRYFFVISDRLLWRCTSSKIATSGNFRHYTVGHILATTLFDFKLLAKIPKSEFVPPIRLSNVEKNAKAKKNTSKFEAHQMALCLVEPRKDLPKLLKLSDAALYAAFVKQLTARRHARVIPTVERLIPGLGLPLLDLPEVTSPSVRIGDLRPDTFLEVFHLMKRNPHFVPEMFLPSNRHSHSFGHPAVGPRARSRYVRKPSALGLLQNTHSAGSAGDCGDLDVLATHYPQIYDNCGGHYSPVTLKDEMANLREKQINAIKIMLNLNQALTKSASINEPQWKVLVYDHHAQDVISPLLSVRELRDMGVTLHMSLNAFREQIDEAPIVYFLQATEENVRQICKDFSQKLYESYYINFTGSIPRPLLEDLATGAVRAGCTSAVSKVFDQYLDFISVEEDLFVLKTEERSPFSFYCLNRGDVKDSEMGPMLDQIAVGLFSVFATLGAVPVIRSARGNAAEHVAEILDRRIRDCLKDTRNTLFMGDPLSHGSISSGRPLLIIVDRSLDLASLLHHTWTYQALVHDVLNMHLNKVDLADPHKRGASKTYSLNPTDSIWMQHRNSPFPKVAEAVQEALDAYKSQEGEVRRLKAQLGLGDSGGADGDEDAAALAALSHSSTVQSLSSAVSSLPDLLEKKRLIDMHTNLATALLDAIKTRNLDEFFEVEERILSHQAMSAATTMIGERSLIDALASKDFGCPLDRIRLAMIWQLCNSDSTEFDKITSALAESEVNAAALKYLKQWRTFAVASNQSTQYFAGGGTKTIHMFSNLLTAGSRFVMAGVKNFVVKQRKLALTRVVDSLAEGKSNTTTDDYRYFDPKTLRSSTPAGSDGMPRVRGPFQDVYVFVVGGGNYIEYANLIDANRMAGGNKRIIYGCTELVTPEQFLAQLTKLGESVP